MKIALRGLCVAAVLAALSAPVLAHHSVAMFDFKQTLTLTGTVKEFQYTNPHAWLQIMVVGTDGMPVQWAFEAEGPSTLMIKGVKVSTFAPGDKVTVTMHPMRDERTAGQLLSVTTADGRVFNF